MSPQVQAGFTRGLVLMLVNALATAGEAAVAHLLTGDNTRTVIIAAVGVLCNTLIARSAEGQFDANRAATLRSQVADGKPLTALQPSDLGHDLLK